MDPAARLRAGRLGALLFTGAGLITLLNAPLRSGSHHTGALLVAGGAAVVVGLLSRLAPWARWPAPASLALVPIALGLIAAGDWSGHASPYSYALYYVLVFAWVGLTQRPGTALVLAPAAALAYVVPVLGGQSRPDMVVSLSDALPVCILVGETIAWAMARLARLQLESTDRVAHLESLIGVGAALECTTDPAHLADEVARVAAAVFDSDQAVALLGPQGRLEAAGRHGPPAATASLARLDPHLVASACARGEPTYLVATAVLIVPLRASLRTIGAVVVGLASAPDEFVLGLAQVFGSQAGLALERHGTVARLSAPDLLDAGTGLGTRAHADALLNALEPGDVVALLAVGGPGQADGEGLLGSFLLRELRTHDSAALHDGGAVLVILRRAGQAAEATTARLAAAWGRAHPSVPLLLGYAVHRPPAFPDDTLADARRHLAPVHVTRPPAPWEGTPWAV